MLEKSGGKSGTVARVTYHRGADRTLRPRGGGRATRGYGCIAAVMKERLGDVYTIVRETVMPDDPSALQAELIDLADAGTAQSGADQRRHGPVPARSHAAGDVGGAGLRSSGNCGSHSHRFDRDRENGDVVARGRRRSSSHADRQPSGQSESRRAVSRRRAAGAAARAGFTLGRRNRRMIGIDELRSRAVEYLLGTIDEMKSRRTEYKLDRMRAFLRALGDPQNTYPTIHVGGTSGKGSTSTMIAAALQASGKRTGLHTKPHLQSMTERARIDGIAVSEKRFAELLAGMMPAIEAVAPEHGRPTYYETLLALAFEHFAQERVDVAVIEVGLGGRLDGTNVIIPVIAAITSVGRDHTEVLGNTIEAIAAREGGDRKAGRRAGPRRPCRARRRQRSRATPVKSARRWFGPAT